MVQRKYLGWSQSNPAFSFSLSSNKVTLNKNNVPKYKQHKLRIIFFSINLGITGTLVLGQINIILVIFLIWYIAWYSSCVRNSGSASVCIDIDANDDWIISLKFGGHMTDSVADLGFSPGGCANSQNCYYFSNFCQKLRENERIWTPGGGARVPGAPLRSANEIFWQ